MGKPAREQRLEELEKDFEPLLIACLMECAERKRWGLFSQNESAETARYLRWKEAAHLRTMAEEIREIRAEWGETNRAAQRFLECCAERGNNLEGEPKRAAKLLNELKNGG